MKVNVRTLGRYLILDEIASGGMATVHLGRLHGKGGFSKVVAIKALHSHFARDPDFRTMFLDEARLVAGITHPNVVSTLDVLDEHGELFLVMDYVHGLPLSALVRGLREKDAQVPIGIAVSILIDTLSGLHAAHEALSDARAPLHIVHRDVSPQNIMLSAEGGALVLDFGVAHAADRLQHTIPGQIKGKASYMAPEQAQGKAVDARADIYGASVVLWETLTGQRLFTGPSFAAVIIRQLTEEPTPPSALRPEVPAALDAIVLRGLAKRPEDRFATALEMAKALEACGTRATRAEVGAWLAVEQAPFFAARSELLARTSRDLTSDASVRIMEGAELPARPSVNALTVAEIKKPTRSRRRRVVSSALLLLGVAAAGVTASRVWHSRTAGAEGPGAPPPPPSWVDAAPSALSLPTVAVASSDTAAPAAGTAIATSALVPTRPAPPRSGTQRPQASAPSAPSAPTVDPPCCTPDGRLQIRFNQCRNNCAP